MCWVSKSVQKYQIAWSSRISLRLICETVLFKKSSWLRLKSSNESSSLWQSYHSWSSRLVFWAHSSAKVNPFSIWATWPWHLTWTGSLVSLPQTKSRKSFWESSIRIWTDKQALNSSCFTARGRSCSSLESSSSACRLSKNWLLRCVKWMCLLWRIMGSCGPTRTTKCLYSQSKLFLSASRWSKFSWW